MMDRELMVIQLRSRDELENFLAPVPTTKTGT